jgi:hypothetical protein
VAAQEILYSGVEGEPQKDLARVAEHHDECHQRTARPADLQVAEVSPVHLGLFTRQAAQAQIGLRRAAWAMLGHEVTEVVGAPAIAALVRHREQAARGQRREFLQRLADQRQKSVDRRPALCHADPGQAGLRQHPPHHAVVDVQLTGDGSDRPFLGVVVAQYLHIDVRRRHHGVWVPSGRVQYGRHSAGADARTPDAAMAGSHDHTNGSVAPAAEARQRREHRHARPQSRPVPADHLPAARVNRDASLSSEATDSGPSGQRAAAGHAGSPGTAAPPPARSVAVPAQRSRGCSRSAPGRSSCK